MFYVVFNKSWPQPSDNGHACAVTGRTYYALDCHRDDSDWFVEIHENWPEERTYENVLEWPVIRKLPASIRGLSKERVMWHFGKGTCTYNNKEDNTDGSSNDNKQCSNGEAVQ